MSRIDALVRLMKDAQARGLRELCHCYGVAVIRLSAELLEEIARAARTAK